MDYITMDEAKWLNAVIFSLQRELSNVVMQVELVGLEEQVVEILTIQTGALKLGCLSLDFVVHFQVQRWLEYFP